MKVCFGFLIVVFVIYPIELGGLKIYSSKILWSGMNYLVFIIVVHVIRL